MTVIYILAIIAILIKFKMSRWSVILCLASFVCVLLWWLTLKPSNSGTWRPDADRTAWTEIDGDRITIHNLRNCDYRTETEYSNCWSDRTLDLSQLRAVDFFLTNWGLSFASHPIISFQFGDNAHIAFSIEARYRPGQSYSTILGTFRQFGLIFVVADERDLIRLRTNYRKDEEVYMYRINADPKVTRAIFFTYVLVLGNFYGVDASKAPLFLIAFAVGNLAGPLTLGHLFDTIGRKKMIAGTYILSGVLLAITAFLFRADVLTATTQTIAWCVIFYFASAGASSAYLTVSEIFPQEVRAKAIAVFFAIAQCFGALGPWLYGHLIGDGTDRVPLFYGYLLGAGVMIVGGLVAAFIGVAAEGKSLEDVATPLAMRRPGTRAEGAARYGL